MLLVNSKQIEQSALLDENSPMFKYADQYKKGIDRLKKNFGKSIRFRRPNYPKSTEGVDSKGRKVAHMAKPTPKIYIPLKASVNGDAGMEIWEYCKGQPELLPNNLYKPTGKRSLDMEDVLTISLDRDPELAFFLYYKSPFLDRRVGKERKGTLVIDDPNFIAQEDGDKIRMELELKNAVYGVLSDNEALMMQAQRYGIAGFDKKHPDTVRKELINKVLDGEKKKKRDPRAEGIKEFTEGLKVSDATRLKHLVVHAEDLGKLVCDAGGRYKCGETDICKVPLSEMNYKQWYVANFLGRKENKEKLQDFLRDVVDEAYLNRFTDDRHFFYLARMMDLDVQFVKKEKVKELVYDCFVVKDDK